MNSQKKLDRLINIRNLIVEKYKSFNEDRNLDLNEYLKRVENRNKVLNSITIIIEKINKNLHLESFIDRTNLIQELRNIDRNIKYQAFVTFTMSFDKKEVEDVLKKLSEIKKVYFFLICFLICLKKYKK